MSQETPGFDFSSEATEDQFTLDSILAEYRKSIDTDKEIKAPSPVDASSGVSRSRDISGRDTGAGFKAENTGAVEEHSPVFRQDDSPSSGRNSQIGRSIRDFLNSFSDADYSRLAEQDRMTNAPAAEPPSSPVAEPVGAAGAPEEDLPSFDESFHLQAEAEKDFRFGNETVDISGDRDYTPTVQVEAPVIPFAKKSEKYLWKRSHKSPGRDEAFKGTNVDEDPEIPESPEEEFQSFKEYLHSIFTSVTTSVGWFFGQINDRLGSRVIEDEVEDPGPEVRPADATRFYRQFIPSMRLRLRISAVLLVIMAWLSFGLPVTGYLKDYHIACLMCLCLQLTVMLACLDTVTTGIMNAVRNKPGAETYTVLFCIVTSFDALLTGKSSISNPHMPLCLISSLSLFGATYSSFLSVRALNKSFIIPKKAKSVYAITSDAASNGTVTLRRSNRSYTGFIHRSEEAAPDEVLYAKLILPTLCISIFLTLIVAIAKKNVRDFFYVCSVLISPMIPFTALLSFAWPYFTGAFRLFHNSSAIAGWSGTSDIGHSKTLIITDRDLFPEGTVEIGRTWVLPKAPVKKVISYAGTLITASGNDLASSFAGLMEENKCRPRSMEAFEILESGGLKGIIEGDVVVCGGIDTMRLLGVKLPSRQGIPETAVLLAVKNVLCGIFEIVYTGDHKVRKALVELMRSSRHPVFALRDFNITPKLLEDVFDVATDGYDFPPYSERFSLTDPDNDSGNAISALISCEGLSKITRLAETGHAMYSVTRINMFLNWACVATGTLVFFIKLLGSGVSNIYIFVFLLLWAIPAVILSVLLPRI